MSQMSALSAEIAALEGKIAQAATDLEAALAALSDVYWGSQASADSPVFKCTSSTVELLEEIELTIDCKILEIRCAA